MLTVLTNSFETLTFFLAFTVSSQNKLPSAVRRVVLYVYTSDDCVRKGSVGCQKNLSRAVFVKSTEGGRLLRNRVSLKH